MFLSIAGATGALISWNDELDAALNPELFRARTDGPPLPALDARPGGARWRAGGGAGLGNPWLYVDARPGALAGADVPGTGSAGDIFLQAMHVPAAFRAHHRLGRRIPISALGVAVATFC